MKDNRMKLNIQMFAIDGSGKSKRSSALLFMNTGTHDSPVWEIIGKDNDDLSRTLNNEVDSKTNVLGETDVEITKGPQTTTVDPYKIRKDSEISSKLYDAYKYDRELDELEHEFMEVFLDDKISEGEYGGFVQNGAIDLKSWGGDTKGLGAPFDINWSGEKTHGKFNPTTKKFTETTTV